MSESSPALTPSPRFALLLDVHAASGLCASDTQLLWGGEASDPYVRLLLNGREVRVFVQVLSEGGAS